MRQLTALQIDVLERAYKFSKGDRHDLHRVQKRIIKRLNELHLLSGHNLTSDGLIMLQKLRPSLFETRDNVINLQRTGSLNKKHAEVVWYMMDQSETLSNNLDNLINYYGLDLVQQALSHKAKNRAA